MKNINLSRIIKISWLFIVLMFGSGLIWQLFTIKYQNAQLELDKVKHSVELREMIHQKLININKLTIEYYDTPKTKKNQKLLQNQLNEIFKTFEDDILEYEKKLAILENREIRIFEYPSPFDDMPPAKPTSIKIIK